MDRGCGILMPVSSLPSPYGIGTLGRAAYEFVDFLYDAGQGWWQMLPVGPTSYGDSPYQSFSTFAGNPYFVDLDELIGDGLLTRDEVEGADWGDDPSRVDYEKIYLNRFELLRLAARRGYARDGAAVEEFVRENEWLPDYALFMALKRHFGMRAWTEWEDEDIRLHRAEAVERYRVELREDVELFTYIQYLFFSQWERLREYARQKGIGVIGDLPIYVAMDSADVWANPRFFQLNEDNRPTNVAGVPPDYFSEDGQLWGNPLYDWDAMREDGYGWWIRRIDGAGRLYDMIRIDHFRGFESYWAVPAGSDTAKIGEWIEGPGIDFINRIKGWFPGLSFIAEDLGFLTEGVKRLLRDSGMPGMKVLEFAFDSREPSDYLPHNYVENCVCYAGTHDNAPLMAWREEAACEDVEMAVRYLGLNDEEGFNWGILRGGMSSVAKLFVAQMQDYLGLGAASRVNTPGIVGGNWQWRLTEGMLTSELARKLDGMAFIYGRRAPRAEAEDEAGQEQEAEAEAVVSQA